MTNVPMQRAAGLSGAADLVRELGADPRDTCSGLSFSAEELEPDTLIPYGEALQFLGNCARVTGLEHFGLLLGLRHDHLSLGKIGQLMDTSPTLGDALRSYVQVQIGLSRGASVYYYPLGDDVVLGYGIYARHDPGARQAYGYTVGCGVNIVRALTGKRGRIVEVLLCHRPPADPSLFETLLGARVRFDQYQSCVVFPRADLRLPNPSADAVRYEAFLAQLSSMMHIDTADSAATLLHQMKPLLIQDAYSLEAVARRLDLHPRTLNRRLRETGTSFVAIRDEVRFRAAQELLALTDLPVGDIALALSFSAHSNFVRAFGRWAGMTPTQWRAGLTSRAAG